MSDSRLAVGYVSRGVWQLHRDLEALVSLILQEFDLLQAYSASHPDDDYHSSYWTLPESIALRKEINAVRGRLIETIYSL